MYDSKVGILIEPPSTAVSNVIGASQYKSFPSLSKSLLGITFTIT